MKKPANNLISTIKSAVEDDWYTEYLDMILSVRVVDSVEQAIEHINHYGSHHSDAIIAESEQAQKTFTREVDSSNVYINAIHPLHRRRRIRNGG